MNNKIYLMAMVLLLSMTFVSAAGFDGVFKSYTQVELTQTCDNGEVICDACNITNIRGPNSDVLVSNIPMQKRTSDFNYTFSDTSTLGVYYVTGFCVDGSEIRNWKYTFRVQSSDPAENNTITFIIFAIISVSLLIISFIFHNYIFAFLSGLSILGTGVYAMANGFGNITSTNTTMIAVIIIGFGAIITIISALEFMQELYGGETSGWYEDY